MIANQIQLDRVITIATKATVESATIIHSAVLEWPAGRFSTPVQTEAALNARNHDGARTASCAKTRSTHNHATFEDGIIELMWPSYLSISGPRKGSIVF